MNISLKSYYLNAVYDTQNVRMVCIPSKYGEVDLAFTSDENQMNIVFATVDTAMPFEEAKAFGYELARRWNECQDKR